MSFSKLRQAAATVTLASGHMTRRGFKITLEQNNLQLQKNQKHLNSRDSQDKQAVTAVWKTETPGHTHTHVRGLITQLSHSRLHGCASAPHKQAASQQQELLW